MAGAPSTPVAAVHEARDPARSGAVFGIKTRLFLAFTALAALTAFASAIAVYGFLLIERTVLRITDDSIPTMAASLQIADKSAQIAAIAPALMASASQQDRSREKTRLEQAMGELDALRDALGDRHIAEDTIEALRRSQALIQTRLNELDAAVAERLSIRDERESAVRRLTRVHDKFIEALEPVIDDAYFELIMSGERVTEQSTKTVTGLIDRGVDTIYPLLVIQAEANLAAGMLVEAANVPDPALLQPIQEQFVAAAATIGRNLHHLSHVPDWRRLQKATDALLALGGGGLFELRAEALPGKRAREARQQMIVAVEDAHEEILMILAPLVDDAIFDLVMDAEQATAEGTRAINDLIDGGVHALHTALTLRAEGNLAAGLLRAATGVLEGASLQPIRERFTAAAAHMERMLAALPKTTTNPGLRSATRTLIDLGAVDGNLFDLRRRELRQSEAAQLALEDSRMLAVELVEHAATLVHAARRASDGAALNAVETIDRGKWIMMAITGLSMVGAAVMIFFYVGPRIVRPLENITTAMTDLAKGDTTVSIPGQDRNDEMGRMARAMGVFKDTAIEMQKSNLAEIRETRQRLMDAIETISEGFSLYDSEDRLVVCNTRYRLLLYPQGAEDIVPGTPFETIIRRAANKGYIKEAEGRIEQWVAERLERHRNPSATPHLQHRGDDSWVLVSERKTRDGGTVAVYSDVTELKRREGELARKSAALEHLSSQLAKYLSPQVYESIFTGKREVEISSSRKKLTVFFSDIVGFTETADRLESEELTALLNHYLTEMSEIALEHGATIDKFIGDAIVIFFGDPESRGAKQDALACVRMALAMRERMRGLQAAWRDSGIERPLRCRTGISTGYCTVGNFGSKDRMDYTIIGGGVNLAARLEAAAAPGEILISYETFAHVKDEIRCEARGEIKVKGIAYPVATYQVMGPRGHLAGSARTPISTDEPNLKLDMDADAMSTDERERARDVLREALGALSPNPGTPGPGRLPKKQQRS